MLGDARGINIIDWPIISYHIIAYHIMLALRPNEININDVTQSYITIP